MNDGMNYCRQRKFDRESTAMNKNTRIRLAAYAVVAVAVFSASAVEFSKAECGARVGPL